MVFFFHGVNTYQIRTSLIMACVKDEYQVILVGPIFVQFASVHFDEGQVIEGFSVVLSENVK